MDSKAYHWIIVELKIKTHISLNGIALHCKKNLFANIHITLFTVTMHYTLDQIFDPVQFVLRCQTHSTDSLGSTRR